MTNCCLCVSPPRRGERTFAHAAPIMWNNHPDSLRSINSVEHFKSALTTYLFELSL